MKTRSNRMKKIVALAEMEERRECIEMGKSQQELDQAVNRLEELTTYRLSYGVAPRAGDSFSAVRWHDYQNFLSRLDQAVTTQKQFVLDGEQNVDAHRHRWMAKRQRLQSLERVLERYRSAEVSQAERALQKTLDDLPGQGNIFDGPAT